MPRLIKFFELEYAVGVPAEIFLAKIRADMPAKANLIAEEDLGVEVDNDGGVLIDQEWADDKIDLAQLYELNLALGDLTHLNTSFEMGTTSQRLDGVEAILNLIEPIMQEFAKSRGDTGELISPEIAAAIKELDPVSQKAAWKHIGEVLGDFPSKGAAQGWITHLKGSSKTADGINSVLRQCENCFTGFAEKESVKHLIQRLSGGKTGDRAYQQQRFVATVGNSDTPVDSGELGEEQQPSPPTNDKAYQLQVFQWGGGGGGGGEEMERTVLSPPFLSDMSPIDEQPRSILQQAALHMQAYDQMDNSLR